jgi:hypothetical protein
VLTKPYGFDEGDVGSRLAVTCDRTKKRCESYSDHRTEIQSKSIIKKTEWPEQSSTNISVDTMTDFTNILKRYACSLMQIGCAALRNVL